MNIIYDDNISEKKEKLLLSKKNNCDNNIFLLKKMLQPNNKNKNKLNISSKKQISNYIKNKLSNKSNIMSLLDNNYEINSFYSNKNYVFGNELLANVMKKNIKKINLKELLNEEKNILLAKKELITKSNNYIMNNNHKKNSSHKKRINSARPLTLDFNKRFKEIEQIINLKENFNYDNMPKILAFKENIFVHEKNLLLDNINHETNEIRPQNNNVSNTNINALLNKSSNNIIDKKFKRPKSAIYGISNLNNNINNIKNQQINDMSIKSKSNNKNDVFIIKKNTKIFDDNYYDLSCVNNKTKKNIQNNKTKFNKKNEKIIISSPYNDLYEFPSEKKLSLNENNMLFEQNLNFDESNKFLSSKMNKVNKENRSHMFMRRTIPVINKKYLLYLPKDIKKDFNNKYNFFSYLLSDNIYYNSSDKKNILNFKKNNNSKSKKKNKIKHNNTDYNFKQNESKNAFKNYKLNCRKEEEFMTYLKELNYIEKHQDLNSSRNEQLIKSTKLRINKVKNIYKPVKIKIDSSTSFEIIKRNKNEISDRKMYTSEEESDLCEKIKSQPFNNKNKIHI